MTLNYNGSGKVFYKQNEYSCDLYVNEEQGGILIKISINEPLSSILKLPLDMEFLSGELSTGYRFTLMNCSRKELKNFISAGKSVFSYSAKYMFKGIGGKDYQTIKFYKVIFELSDIIEWGNIAGYIVGENQELIYNANIEKVLYENEEFKIKYIVKRDSLPIVDMELLKETITLQQSGNIEISFVQEENIEEFEKILKKFRRLIEISALKIVTVKRVTGWSKDIKQKIGEREFERPLSIISYDFYNDNSREDAKKNSWRWVSLTELVDNNSFSEYIQKYEILEPIVELYLEILEARDMSTVSAFLNIVQALETYHARFKANEMNDFIIRIEEVILKNRPKSWIPDDKKFLMANSRGFITLESRLADLLLADFQIYFDTGDIEHYDFPKVIAKTRNYYTHYDEGIKESARVLTKEELMIYNNTLLYMLEYYLLLELGFSDEEVIRKKLNFRWGNASETLSLRKESKELFDENWC